MQDVIRLTGQSKSILATYGETPNKAIYSMSDAIRTLQKEVSHQKDVTDALQTAFKSVTNSNNVTKPLQEFQSADSLRMEYKGKKYALKQDANGTEYIIHETRGKLQVRDKKVIE